MEGFNKVLNTVSETWNKVKGAVTGSNVGEVEAKARGGFTKGVAICGEAGTEAVISFDPAYRAENQRYVATAASLRALEDCIPDVLDKLQEEANARKLHQYA